MKRKFLAYLCISVMAVSLIGCGSATITSTPTTSNEDETTTDEDETTTDEDETTTDEEETNDPDSSDWKAYTGDGFTVYLSVNWTKISGSNMTFKHLVTSKDELIDNFAVAIQDLSAYDYDLESYKDLSMAQYEQLNADIVENEKVTIDGQEGYCLDLSIEQDGTTFYYLQFYTVIDDSAYVFTFTADKNAHTLLYDEVLEIFSNIEFD